ncbi:hypothetical protein ACYSNX_10165 [Myroides sp. LJL115]
MKRNFFLTASLLLALNTLNAQEQVEPKVISTLSQNVEGLAQEKAALDTKIQIEKLEIENNLSEAKRLKQEQKIADQKLKAELKAQKQQEKEHKRALKKQKEIISAQNKLDKATSKLHKAQDKFNKATTKFQTRQALGKTTPIEELKTKAVLLKLQTKVTEAEFEVKKLTLQFETLTK